ncbi:MAG: hypothetical protein HQK96_02360 [Nitrospirae bacterium]|nr:hypothetical protein [Nitrospirota bacterium]
MKKIYVLAALMAGLLIFGQQAFGFGGPGDSGPGSSAMMPLPMKPPIVTGSDGTAYVESVNTAGTVSGSLTSNITAITSSGAKQAIAVNGKVMSLVMGKDTSSRDTLVAVAGVPPQSTNSTPGSPSTVLYFVSLPFNQSATPVSVSLDGMNASEPVFVNGFVYITTSSLTFSNSGTPGSQTSYLYIVGTNGSIVSQVAY